MPRRIRPETGDTRDDEFAEALVMEAELHDAGARTELTPGEFLDRYPLTTVTAAFLAGAAATGGVLSGTLASKLALRGGPVGMAMHRVVSAAVPMVRATAMRSVRRAATRAVGRVRR
ncbi:MAG: hypothetical protein EA398_01310 [Deltaproteobacteria bacterium]|nr:MAG: hypothetical protein EA398_01310 [Deltaproteobacteria bacterium]